MLLQEFDPNPSAVINPWGNIKPVQDCPRVAVSCFELRTFDRMVERLGGVEIMRLKKANWDAPVYRTEYKGVEIALFEAYVGAAGCMGVLEELFAAGVEKLVLFGTCGVLDRSIGDCGIIIPTVALRDEGASFHYAPPSDEIEVNPGQGLDHGRLLPGDGGKDGAPEGGGVRVRGYGVFGGGRAGPVPGEGCVSLLPRLGQSGRRGMGGVEPQPGRQHHRQRQGRAAGPGAGGEDRGKGALTWRIIVLELWRKGKRWAKRSGWMFS